MTVECLAGKLGAKFLAGEENRGREISEFYAGDLLSHVMGKLPEGACWFTIMNNVNVAAVALLTDAVCVTLCEGVQPDAALLAKSVGAGFALLSVNDSIYRAIVRSNA